MKSLPATSSDIGYLFLRLATGLTLLTHGYFKFAGGETFLTTVGTNWSAALGIHFAPFFWGIFVATVQTLGGLLIALGFLTRTASSLMAFVMLVGAVMVFEKGLPFKDWSHPFEAGLTCIAIAIMGSGQLSLSRLFCRKSL